MSKYFLVNNKPDDYGNCLVELVQTSETLAKQYYHSREVKISHVAILKKYFELLLAEYENTRTADERYYGGDEQ